MLASSCIAIVIHTLRTTVVAGSVLQSAPALVLHTHPLMLHSPNNELLPQWEYFIMRCASGSNNRTLHRAEGGVQVFCPYCSHKMTHGLNS